MKKLILLALPMLLLPACSAEEPEPVTPLSPGIAKQMLDVPYGEDSQQKLDLYLPAGRVTDQTKVFVLVHGGGWKEGDKADVNFMISYLKEQFPNYAIANVNYRLGTLNKLGNPRQLEDLKAALKYLSDNRKLYDVSNSFGLIGFSAGAHLSLLHAYRYDTGRMVKSVCSVVGPCDFSDPNYEGNGLFASGLRYFVGDYPSYSSNPTLYSQVSPALYVTAKSPKTLMLYGKNDELVPLSQGQILHDRLTARNVYNEYYAYDMGHIGWSVEQLVEMQSRITAFFNLTFN